MVGSQLGSVIGVRPLREVVRARKPVSTRARWTPLRGTLSGARRETRVCANGAASLDMKLEVVVLPVSDVDRSKAFYLLAGFREDFDYASGEDFRVVQFTPPGSGASVVFGTGITDAPSGSVEGLQLVVADIEAARARLIARGIDVTDIFHDIGGVFYHRAPAYEIPGVDPSRRSYASFARFSDPDGNEWVLQEVGVRAPGR